MDRSQEDLAVWRRLAPGGLLLVGAGASVIADAATRKSRSWDPPRGRSTYGSDHPTDLLDRLGTPGWVAEGTLGLTLLGAGLSLFGESVKRRALHDVAERARHDAHHDPER